MSGQPITLTGRSGYSYPFTLFPVENRFEAIGAVYVAISRQSPVALLFLRPNSLGDGLAAQFVGQTSDLSLRMALLQQDAGWMRVGVCHVAVMVEHDEQRRTQIEADLIAALQPPLNRADHE